MALIDNVKAAMIGGGSLDLQIDPRLNYTRQTNLPVFLRAIPNGVRISADAPGEANTILWLPWVQGEFQVLRESAIEAAPAGRLFLTSYLSGCKLFAIRGGPVWHIDAMMTVSQFWPRILNDEWVEDNWPAGTARDVAYLRRDGQNATLWDLSAQLQGNPPTTYGNRDSGMATVGGIVNAGHQLDLYFKSSPWAPLRYAAQRRKK